MSAKKPMLLVIAGPNGSGKSTISQYFEKVGEYTNADDVVASTGMSIKDATEFVEKKRYEAIDKKIDFSFETVLSSEYNMRIIRKAKEEGYFIKCIFILTVDPLINVARVESRVESGGHDVPRDKIIARYEKSLGRIRELIDLCDILHVYDNTTENPLRIIRKHKKDITVFPNNIWDLMRIEKLLIK